MLNSSSRLTKKPREIDAARVRLIRKFAQAINGVDLSSFQVGDVIRAPEPVAMMLMREGWAELLTDSDKPADA